MRTVGLVLGLVIVLGTLGSVFTTLVVPRMTSSRLLRAIAKVLGKSARPVVRQLTEYSAQDRLMGLIGPLAMMLLFLVWLALLTLGYGLLAWWVGGATFLHSLAVSASSITTLGVLALRREAAEGVEFVAAATGLLVVALEIAYLPTLYSAFSTRETEVTLLASRAGIPAWGPELLSRHHRFGTMAELPDLYRTWERWAAGVAETHTNYPALLWLRSPVPWRSWLTALVAMMDAAALHDAVSPGAAPRQGRICLQAGTGCLRAIAGALHIDFDPDPLPTNGIRLTYEEFLQGIDRLERAEFPFERTPEDAWRHFVGWRVNYEAIADVLTTLVMPPPAPWFPVRPALGELQFPRVLDRTPDDPEATRPRT